MDASSVHTPVTVVGRTPPPIGIHRRNSFGLSTAAIFVTFCHVVAVTRNGTEISGKLAPGAMTPVDVHVRVRIETPHVHQLPDAAVVSYSTPVGRISWTTVVPDDDIEDEPEFVTRRMYTSGALVFVDTPVASV